MANHIIHRQQVVLKTGRKEQVQALQEAVSRMMKNGLPTSLEAVLDEVMPPDEVLRIDSLQLDLGTVNEDDFEQVFEERLTASLRQAVIEKGRTKENGTTVFNKVEALRHAFLHFLRRGVLPWYKAKMSRPEWESEMIAQFSDNDWSEIVQWLQQEEKIPGEGMWRRLTGQFSRNFLQSFSGLQAMLEDTEWKDVYAALLQIGNCTAQPAVAYHELWVAVISLPMKEIGKYSAVRRILETLEWRLQVMLKKAINEEFAQTLPSMLVRDALVELLTARVDLRKSKEENISASSGQAQSQQGAAAFPNEGGTQYANGLPANDRNLSGTGNVLPSGNEARQLTDVNKGGRKMARKKRETAEIKNENIISSIESRYATNRADGKAILYKPEQPEAMQYVVNCGIVLLHPFLEMYFTELDLLHKKQFIDKNACARAVLLLHYLATGEIEGEEWNLLLQKLICGFPFDETLPNRFEIAEKEKEESERLLQSVISYCPPLKNTSLAGLRSTFLQRDGRMEKKENGWLLTVGQKTVDILLDKLPWGFSTIKFPWLTDMINVDWC